MEEVLKFFLGDESVNKDNAIEDDSLAEYDGTTAVDVLTDTDDVEDLSSEEGNKFSWACNLLFPSWLLLYLVLVERQRNGLFNV